MGNGRRRQDLGTTILVALRERSPLSQTEIMIDVFRRNIPAYRVRAALEALAEASLITKEIQSRPFHPRTVVWKLLV